jgi:hypothetical protein
MFIVHRESESKPHMEFKMHKSGLQYYDLRKEHHMTFVNTVSEQDRLYQAANQVCRNCTKPVKDLELPVHEGFQVGNLEQSDQILPHDDSRH